jgi:hypothetical protein
MYIKSEKKYAVALLAELRAEQNVNCSNPPKPQQKKARGEVNKRWGV